MNLLKKLFSNAASIDEVNTIEGVAAANATVETLAFHELSYASGGGLVDTVG